MKYDVQGIGEFYLTAETELSAEQFENKLHPENIIKATLQIVLSDGLVKNIDVMEYLKLKWVSHTEKENY